MACGVVLVSGVSPPVVNSPIRVAGLDLTDEETAALLQQLDGLIDGERYFLSPRIKTLKAIRARIRPEPAHEPLPAPEHRRPAGPMDRRESAALSSFGLSHSKRP
jgi:hypothetical protein